MKYQTLDEQDEEYESTLPWDEREDATGAVLADVEGGEMMHSFWVHIACDPALIEELTEADVKVICEEIKREVRGVVEVTPADPETYVE